jgi:hypothetical protein
MDAFSTALVNMNMEDGLEFRKKVMNDFNCDFEIIYITEDIKNNTIEILSTSDFNETLEINKTEGISLKYVE